MNILSLIESNEMPITQSHIGFCKVRKNYNYYLSY